MVSRLDQTEKGQLVAELEKLLEKIWMEAV